MISNHLEVSNSNELIRVVPNDVYLQDIGMDGDLEGEFLLINPTPNYLAFKVKTNAIHKYSVKPVMGILIPNGRKTVSVRGIKRLWADDHQFLLQIYPLSRFEVNEWTHIKWKSLDSDLMHQLVMHVYLGSPPTPVGSMDHVLGSNMSFRTAKLHLPPEPIQLDQLSPKVRVRPILLSRENTLVDHGHVDHIAFEDELPEGKIPKAPAKNTCSFYDDHSKLEMKVSKNYDKMLNQQVLIVTIQAVLLILTVCIPILMFIFAKLTGIKIQFTIG